MLPEDELDKFIAKYGLPRASQWKNASSKNMMKKAIDTIRSDGYAYQESERQIIGFAVPVMQGTNTIAAISVYIPSYRLNNIDQQSLIKALKKAAESISKELSS